MTFQRVEQHLFDLRLSFAEELLGGLREEDGLPHDLDLGHGRDGHGDSLAGEDGLALRL